MVRGDVCAKKLLEFAKKWGKKEWIVCKTGIIITSTFQSFHVRITIYNKLSRASKHEWKSPFSCVFS